MGSRAVLDQVVDDLGYRGGPGYVEGGDWANPRGEVWSELHQKCGVTAAFFKGAIPIVAFVASDSHEEALQAHRRLWNYGRVPLLIATTEHEVLALSCNTAPHDSDPDAALLERAEPGVALAQVLHDFTRFSVESGDLARRRGTKLDKQNRVDQTLLRNLRALRSKLLAEGVLESEIEPLLGRTIFIRYLEDRHILGAPQLSELGQPPSLADALEQGWDALSRFFAAMSEHFSGDVFRVDTLTRRVPDSALRTLSLFFHGGNVETGQTALWPYDFSIIPPEFISSIYEQLLVSQQKADAAYYTPRHVVDVVLDELLPSDVLDNGSVPTILDPACGSGIFLTEAFRRLVQRRRRALSAAPDYEELKTLLIGSIFGIDLNPDAIGVTAFGLYLALLEHVDPRTIWVRVQLPRLVGTNLVVSDFFGDHSLSSQTFDVIAGNPPWQSKLTTAARQFVTKSGRRVPDQQIAAAFMWRVAEMLSQGGAAGLVMPAKTILHNRNGVAEQFRLELFCHLRVQTVVDLSPLRKGLFGAATSPAALIIFSSESEPPLDHLLHVSPRRTPISEIVDGMVLPQQNIQRISQSTARTDPRVWKTLLWGGPSDVALVTHLRENFRTLLSHAADRGWTHGSGYQVSGGGLNDATHLHDIKTVRTKDVAPLVPPSALLPPTTAEVMHRPRSRQIFLAPHILLRNGFARTPISAFAAFDAAFADGLFAISGPAEDAAALRAVAAVLNSTVAHYWYFMTGSSWGVERDKVELQEWLTLPLPHLSSQVEVQLAEVTAAAASGKPRPLWQEKLDDIVADSYGLSPAERQLVKDAMTVRLSEYKDGPSSDSYQPAQDEELDEYTGALEEQLGDLELGEWTVAAAERRYDYIRVTCTHRGSGTGSADTSSESFTVSDLLGADSRLGETLSSATIVEPQAVVLDGTKVHVIKPNRRAYWTASSAALDASDVFGALISGDV